MSSYVAEEERSETWGKKYHMIIGPYASQVKSSAGYWGAGLNLFVKLFIINIVSSSLF